MKGKMRKLFAFALAAIMVLAMGITASASGTDPVGTTKGKIIIENPVTPPESEDGEETINTYVAYKIFSVTTSTNSDNGTNYGYKLDDSSVAYELLTGLTAEEQAKAGVKLISTTVDGEFNVEVTDAPAFAQYLKSKEKTFAGGIQGEYNDTTKKVEIEIPADAMGYYFISTTSGTLANLTTASSTTPVTIYDKNEKPEIKKTTTLTGDVQVGQNVPYTITGTVPSTVGYETYTYVVTDKMGDALTFNNDLVVKVNNVVIYENGSATNNAPANSITVEGEQVEDDVKTADFKVTFDMTKFEVGKNVEITYSATVNENAVKVVTGTENPLKNEAHLEYSKDPNNTDTDKTTGTDVTLYTANIEINKVVTGTTTPLANAKFVLVDKVDKDDEGNITGVADDANYYQYIPAKEATGTEPAVKAEVKWGTKENATVVTTGNDGKASFQGLKDGTYYLVETEAPAGYNLMTVPQEVKVTHDADKSGKIEEVEKVLVTQLAQVENSTGTTLPSTGGIGTTIFYVVGGILVVVAGILLITKKRMSGRD